MSHNDLDNNLAEQYRTPGHRQSVQVLTCCVIGFICFLGAYMRIPVLPLLASSIGAGTAQIGLINAAFMLSAGILAVPSGLLSDRIGIRPVLITGLALMSCASLIIPFCDTPLLLGGIYLFFGMGLSAFTPTMMSSVARVVPRSHVGRAYSWYTTAVYLAMTFGPATGGWFGKALGIREVFFVSGGLIVAALIAVLLFLPAPEQHHHDEHVDEPASGILSNRRLLAALVGTLGGCFGFGMFISFLPLHARALGLNVGQIGIIFAAQALVNVLLRIPFGHLSDRVDRGLMSGIGLVLCAHAVGAVGLAHGMVTLLICACVLGAGMGIGFTALSALVVVVMPPRQRGLGLGLYNSCIYLGMMLSSATMGMIIKAADFATGFFSAGAVTFILAVLFSYLYRDTMLSLKTQDQQAPNTTGKDRG
ncbi:MFS transporter [Geomonas subterranea]|uniref:MFS transporter n=1 Tax=Geomonas subterranea TaxID=2847989 RepID=A0ABX8LLN2_9BACT|nr:MFS transporter [Geomonas subterranea]QXE92960.1 MFS transporter [Geomonas subterranea]QXM08934.1 MFS transporter [Geomonas subterranea]